MKELIVISGKGGTGKTSILASLAVLAGRSVVADCDVDAADLHLVLEPDVRERHEFSGGSMPHVDPTRCTGCGKCVEVCRFGAVTLCQPDGTESSACRSCEFCVRSCSHRIQAEMHAMMAQAGQVDNAVAVIDPIACEGCGVCAWFCPHDAIEMKPAVNGEWFVSQTRVGPMVHARLGVAEENSGKLVNTVRTAAREQAEQAGLDLVLVDGPPGIGCPVIASITGSDRVLIVTEPTRSGLHDLKRVAELTRHFNTPAMVCVNKWDLNPDMATEIETQARQWGLSIAGRVRYDRGVTGAQTQGRTVVECGETGVADDVRALWETVHAAL